MRSTLKFLLHILKQLGRILFLVMRIFPIKQNRIVFNSYMGSGYGDSGKYICESLHKKYGDKNIDIVWLVNSKKNANTIPKWIRPVRQKTIASLYNQCTAKIWVDNARKRSYVLKRKEQYYIQTWHGGIMLKMIEHDAENELSYDYKKCMQADEKMVDLMMSGSRYTADIYRRAFKYDGEILQCGTPRNDYFNNIFSHAEINKIRKKLSLKEGQKILLYAPTFRTNYEHNPYDLDYDKIRKTLNNSSNSEWVILIRMHPAVKKNEYSVQENAYIKDVTNYPDMQELELLSDMVITDYSSVMFDYLQMNKPALLYVHDLNNYLEQNRKLYFNFKNLPFYVFERADDLTAFLGNPDFSDMNKKYSAFKKQIGLSETGHASEKIADIIVDKLVLK